MANDPHKGATQSDPSVRVRTASSGAAITDDATTYPPAAPKESPAGLRQWLSENELKPYLGLLDRAQKAESALVKINKLCDDIELCSDVRYMIQQIVKETATNLQQESPAGSAPELYSTCPKCGEEYVDAALSRARDRLSALERELAEARADAETLKEAHNALIEDVEEHVEDTKRLDFLERGLMDGSYQSIWNDIIAFCEVGYKAFGRGPALRSAIDVQRDAIAAIAAERKEEGNPKEN